MKDYCKTCCHDDGDIGFCDKCFYNHILEEKGIPPTEYEAKPNPMTNADRIRAMSDEELANFCVWMCPPGKNEILSCEPQKELCRQCWLDWLRQEAQDG